MLNPYENRPKPTIGHAEEIFGDEEHRESVPFLPTAKPAPELMADEDDPQPYKWRLSEEKMSLELWPDATQTKRKYLHWLAETGSIFHACKYSGVGKATVLRWRKDDAFQRWEATANELAVEVLEGYGMKRAKDGSDRLLMAMLAAKKPAVYGQQVKVTLQPMPEKKIELIDHREWTIEPPAKPKELPDGS